jgi:hypothetical protein
MGVYMVKKAIDKGSKDAPAEPGAEVDHPYAATDPLPVPEAVESDTDTTWALWENLTTEQTGRRAEADSTFAQTVLDTLPLPLTPETPKRS